MTVQPEVMSPPPPGWTVDRWARVVTACRSMDARANYGAGPNHPPSQDEDPTT